jgi:hypothetical protein
MAQIPINVEASCAQHPRLKPGNALPRNGQTRVTQQRLFTLGSLWLQDDAKAEFRTFAQTQLLWDTLNLQYSAYLIFEPQQLTTDAVGEKLTQLSEVVGVGLGIAAMYAQFEVNLNRFRRFVTVGSHTRRVDFEYYSGGQRFFHETKGTTYATSVQRMCDDIADQKNQTQQYVADQASQHASGTSIGIAGSTGSVALYRHTQRTELSSLITLIDPPPVDLEGTRSPSESDELACVLRYYQNFYSVTHSSLQNEGSLGLAEWLAQVASGLEKGQPAPTSPPPNLRVRARLTEPGLPESLYRGTIFDARLARRSVLSFPTFEAANESIPAPVTFLGVSQEVTNLVQGCQWNDLLAYSDSGSNSELRDGIDISESGIMSKRIDSEEINEESRRSFRSLKSILSGKR